MPKRYSAHQVVSALQSFGFIVVRQKGSHIKMRKSGSERTLTAIVPNHREIAVGTLDSILEQANLSKDEFEKFVQ